MYEIVAIYGQLNVNVRDDFQQTLGEPANTANLMVVDLYYLFNRTSPGDYCQVLECGCETFVQTVV